MTTTDRPPVPPVVTSTGDSGKIAVSRRHLGAVWLGVLFFSTGPVLAASATTSGLILAFWRLWLGVPLLGGVALWQLRRARHWPGWNGWRWSLVAGLAFAFHQVLLMSALQQTSVVDVTLMNTLAPVVVAVLAVPLFGERPGVSFRLWSAVAIAGAAVVALASSTGPQGHPVGIILAAGNVVFYALFFVWSKLARPHLDVAPFLAGTLVVAAVVISAWVAVTGAPVSTIGLHDLVVCLAIAVVPGFAGHFLVTWSLRWVPANIPPVIMLSIPALSGVLAWFVLGQHVTLVQVIGGTVTLVGVFAAVQRSSSLAPTSVESLDLAEEL